MMTLAIPESMRQEHESIHAELAAAARESGPVGDAARELAEILHPHFEREEEIALPPLALLEPLARGEFDPEMRSVLLMTRALQREWSKMLREHVAIGAAARHLEDVARGEGRDDVERLARALQLHAKTEEELLYPAAILVGEIVRGRDDGHR